ncbi:protein FAM43A-like [Octopus vulgaris]|uniref:Protein FAM43A-like n=1 Tax=Octopus vulgaris TaxID=6645 RepID=A0AA36BKH3_OCTVU|nr:protein FAM43A-like [Octopus vulgaris]
MSFFSWRRKSLNISEEDPAYKVRYLGNIHTCMMKGEGCVDKPASILWNNYLQSSHQALDMKIVVSVSGIKAYTKEQGLMQYWSHKISYIIAHPQYPRMFLWVYRHEGRKMKLDLRCHAVLCKSEAKAKLLDVQLHEKLSFALKEFVRDKRRKHNSRLIFEKTNSELTNGSILPLRQQMLSQGGKFKPPVSKMNSAPKLGSIFELDEKEEEKKKEFDSLEEEEETEEKRETNSNIYLDPKNGIKEEECEEDEEEGLGGMNDSIDDEDDDGNDADDDFCTESDVSDGIDSLALDPESDNASVSSDHVCQTDGLKQDDMDFLLSKPKKSDSDGESSESGFSDSSKEIGLYRVDDGDRLNDERDDVGLGSNNCCLMQCDKDTNCHNDNSFDGDNEDDALDSTTDVSNYIWCPSITKLH